MHQHHPGRELQLPIKSTAALFIDGRSGIVVADGNPTGGHLKLVQQVGGAFMLFWPIGLDCNVSLAMCRALGAGADLKEFDIDNKYGLAAIKHCLQDITRETSVMPGVQVRQEVY